MISRMEQSLDEIEEYLSNCKTQPLSSGSKIIVGREDMEEFVADLRANTPDEIKKYQKIISNKEAIMADARAKADEIIAAAQIQTSELVSEHQIMQQAYAQANEVVMIATQQAQEILDKATNDSNAIRMSAIEYTDDMLMHIEEVLSQSIESAQSRTNMLVDSLQMYADVVAANRSELFPSVEELHSEDSQQQMDIQIAEFALNEQPE
ncbi:MAG: ATPase [Lachnospiraceae bacterium]